MSCSFPNQALAQLELAAREFPVQVMTLPRRLDEEVARLHLERLGVRLDTLTPEQARHLGVAADGPFRLDHDR